MKLFLWQTTYSLEISTLYSSYNIPVVIDVEHTSISFSESIRILSIYKASQTEVYLRTPDWNNSNLLNRYLDLGLDGFILPRVKTLKEITSLWDQINYPYRGACLSMMNQFGKKFNSYKSSFIPKIIPMIETEELLQDLNSILSLNYIDSCFLGPYDLSQSLSFESVDDLYKSPILSDIKKAFTLANKNLYGHVVINDKDTIRSLSSIYDGMALSTDLLHIKDGIDSMIDFIQ